MQDAIGNEAITVFMAANTLVTGIRWWDFATDLYFFARRIRRCVGCPGA